MTNRKTPNIDEWRLLYEAALSFKALKPWEWMDESFFFGVKNPEGDETAYCSIMGRSGEHYAIAAYEGFEGLNSILGMINEDRQPASEDIMFMIKCLMCSFENRDLLMPGDQKIIKELGLKFRGKNEWPLFRDYKPGFVPWFLGAKQCRFLTHIINQAIDVSLRCRADMKMLETENPFTFLVRTPVPGTSGELGWVDEYASPDIPEKNLISFEISDEVRAHKIRSYKVNKQLALECDIFYIPVPVKEKGRPYYPRACMLVGHNSGSIVSFVMFKSLAEEGYKCLDMLLEHIEQQKQLPSKILVSNEETYALFSDVCRQLNIRLEDVDYLDFTEEAKGDMFQYMLK